ncbi:MAG: hypothetical protein ACREP6_10485 [Candidatus Binataceae bacterium]
MADQRGPRPRRIAPPDGCRAPMRVNLFERMRSANAQLVPLFPYLGAGAIVPAGAVFRGEPNASFGQFFHWNTVDEVVICLGAEGAFTDTGQVHVGQNMHGVNSFLKNPGDPNSFLVTSITQRQRIGEKQREAVIVRCAQCKEIVMRVDFDATPPPADTPESADAIFPTLLYSARAVEQFNASESARTCGKCGALNPRFPLERWGWSNYAGQSQTAADARRALDQASRRE